MDFNKSYLESQNRLLTDSTKKLAEEKEKSESRYFDTRSELETTRTDLRQEVNKNKANQQVIKDLKAQIANLMLNKKSETASLEYFSPSKTLLSELSSLEYQQKEITLLEKTVEGLNKQVSDQTARADDLEQQLVRYCSDVTAARPSGGCLPYFFSLSPPSPPNLLSPRRGTSRTCSWSFPLLSLLYRGFVPDIGRKYRELVAELVPFVGYQH